MRVTGYSPKDMDAEIEIVLDEAPMSAALLDFGWRIFLLSLAISIFTAGLVFLTLHWVLVRPAAPDYRQYDRFPATTRKTPPV